MGKVTQSSKADRNKRDCATYTANKTAEKSKARKLIKHMKRYGFNDPSATTAYDALPASVKKLYPISSPSLNGV